MTNYDKIISLFLGNDELRPVLHKPTLINDFVYACDARSAVKIPHCKLNKTYHENDGYPDIKAVYRRLPMLEKPIDLRLQELKVVIKKVPIVNVMAECSFCEGEGFFECERCNQGGDCPECKGDGSTDEVIGQTYDPEYVLEISNMQIKVDLVDKLIKACTLLNLTQVQMWSNTPMQGCLFKLKDVEVILMPVPSREYEKNLRFHRANATNEGLSG